MKEKRRGATKWVRREGRIHAAWAIGGIALLGLLVLVVFLKFQPISKWKPKAAVPEPKREEVEMTTEDRNGDGEPDIFFYRRSDALFRINSDRNFDGKLDEWIDVADGRWTFRKADENFDRIVDLKEFFNRDGTVETRERDLDYDNVFDFKEYFDGNGSVVRAEHDTNEDGASDVWKFFEVGTALERPLLRGREIDVNFDGKPDRWQEFDDESNLLRERVDTDFDGEVDKVV